jgi:hypothetical protein
MFSASGFSSTAPSTTYYSVRLLMFGPIHPKVNESITNRQGFGYHLPDEEAPMTSFLQLVSWSIS